MPHTLSHEPFPDAVHSHRAFIENRLPQWLRQADTEARGTYLRQARDNAVTASAAKEILRTVKSPHDFARPLLVAALKEHFGLDLDVDRTELVRVRDGEPWLAGTLQVRCESLLDAALGNFEAEQAQPGAMDPRSVIVPREALQYDFDAGVYTTQRTWSVAREAIVPISPEAFAGLCRDLDVGGQYQREFTAIFTPIVVADAQLQANTVASLLTGNFLSALTVQAQAAVMKNLLSATARDLLQQLCSAPDSAPRWEGQAIAFQGLRLLNGALRSGYCLQGALTFIREDGRLIAFLPGHPQHALEEHASLVEFAATLRERLRDPAYQGYLAPLLLDGERAEFFARLNNTLAPLPVSVLFPQERVPDPDADIGLGSLELSGSLGDVYYRQWLAAATANVGHLAVSTADADTQAREERLQRYLQDGLSLLNVASLFIPSLGAVMAGVGAFELLQHVFVGIDDWRHGQTEEALGHLGAVLENLVLVGAAAGAKVAIEHSPFVESMVEVTPSEGESRLWAVDLDPYRSEVSLSEREADASGLYLVNDAMYIDLEGHAFEVRPEPLQEQWTLIHPQRAEAYRPIMRHDRRGAWWQIHEQPLEWSAARLLSRFGPATRGIDPQTLVTLQRISGVEDARLRALFVEGKPLPVELEETLRRFRVDRQIDALAVRIGQGLSAPAGMHYPTSWVPQLPGWPADTVIEVIGGPDENIVIHGGPETAHSARIIVQHTEVEQGRLLQRVLDQLPIEQCEALLGGPQQFVDRPAAEATLQSAFASLILSRRAELFDVYSHLPDTLLTAEGAALHRDFPSLPPQCVDSLLENLSDAEREQLVEDNRVPLRVGEEARLYLRTLRLNQALEGFHIAGAASLDRDCLAMGFLDQVPGWSRARIELRSDSLSGTVLGVAGDPADGDVLTLVRRGRHYSGYDPHQAPMHESQDLFSSLLAMIPGDDRAALQARGLDAVALRHELGELAISQRTRSQHLLHQRTLAPWFRLPPRDPLGRIGYPLSGRGELSSAHKARLRKLYPAMNRQARDETALALRRRFATLAQALDHLEQEFKVLSDELERWVTTPSVREVVGGADLTVSSVAKRRAAEQIIAVWRRVAPMRTDRQGVGHGYSLVLSNLKVGSLPTLSANFDHVEFLRLDRMDLSRDPSDFLRNFARVQHISLNLNRLTQIPEALPSLIRLRSVDFGHNWLRGGATLFAPLRQLKALRELLLDHNMIEAPALAWEDLSELTQLESLYLFDNRLEIDAAGFTALARLGRLRLLDLGGNRITLNEQTQAIIGGMSNLRELYLNDNPLGLPPLLGELRQLKHLSLSRGQLTEWPDDLLPLLNDPQGSSLRRINLARNQIRSVPPLSSTIKELRRADELKGKPFDFMLNLGENPLGDDQIRRLRRDLVVFLPPLSRVSAPDSEERVPDWLLGSSPELRRRIAVDRLDPQSRLFYATLDQVSRTADYRAAPGTNRRRMWTLAEVALGYDHGEEGVGLTDLREQLFAYADDVAGTCGDGVALILNQFEALVTAWQAVSSVLEGGEAMLTPLIISSERMFRLTLVDECAARIAQRRSDLYFAATEVDHVLPLPPLDPLDDFPENFLQGDTDEVELRLVIRLALVDRLDLPAQPQEMLYRELVTANTLDRIETHVRSLATQQALLPWLIEQSYWRTYIERVYETAFAELRDHWLRVSTWYEEATSADEPISEPQQVPVEGVALLEALLPHVAWRTGSALNRVALSEGDYLTAYDFLFENYRREHAQLIERLSAPLVSRLSRLPSLPSS